MNDKHLEAIRAHRITRSNLIGMRKALNTRARHVLGYSISATSPKAATDGRAEQYEQAVQQHAPFVCADLYDSGAAILRNPRWRKRFNDAERAVIDSGISGFRLIRFDWISRTHCVPVYRVIGYNGDSFAFRNIPWQSADIYGCYSGPTVECDSTR